MYGRGFLYCFCMDGRVAALGLLMLCTTAVVRVKPGWRTEAIIAFAVTAPVQQHDSGCLSPWCMHVTRVQLFVRVCACEH